MKFPLLSRDTPREVLYASERTEASRALPGVTFTVRRISAASRLDLIGRLGALAAQLEMLRASESLPDRVQAEALRIQIDREYLLWGLSKLRGLRIDGAPADAELLFTNGPEPLVREIVQCIRKECELDADERKN
jgi:hypothetical protein